MKEAIDKAFEEAFKQSKRFCATMSRH